MASFLGVVGHVFGISLGCCEGGRVEKDMLEGSGVRQALQPEVDRISQGRMCGFHRSGNLPCRGTSAGHLL